jgi:hypothetical protein
VEPLDHAPEKLHVEGLELVAEGLVHLLAPHLERGREEAALHGERASMMANFLIVS